MKATVHSSRNGVIGTLTLEGDQIIARGSPAVAELLEDPILIGRTRITAEEDPEKFMRMLPVMNSPYFYVELE